MPSDREMQEHQALHKVRLMGIYPSAGSEPPRLGELVVVPYADHVNALAREFDRGRAEERVKHHADQCCRVCDTHTMPHRGCILR